VSMIEELIAKETDPVVLDSAEVTRRPRGGRVPRNLRCEGIRLRNCPGFIEFIQEWRRWRGVNCGNNCVIAMKQQQTVLRITSNIADAEEALQDHQGEQ
jgi:hypothetical protein